MKEYQDRWNKPMGEQSVSQGGDEQEPKVLDAVKLRDIAHNLWYQGGRLRINLSESLTLHPENWHEEGLRQRLEEWDKAAETYFDYALISQPLPLLEKDEQSASDAQREEDVALCAHCDQRFRDCKCAPDRPLLTKWASKPSASEQLVSDEVLLDIHRNASSSQYLYFQMATELMQWRKFGAVKVEVDE